MENQEITLKKRCDIISVLYSSYSRELLAYIKNRIEDKEESYDILHDIFITLLEKQSTELVVNDHFKSYLFRCASNRITDRYRRVGSMKLETLEPEAVSGTDYIFDLETTLISGEVIDTIHGAMTALNEEEADIIFRKFYNNEKKSKICSATNLSRYKLDKMLSNIILKVKENLPSYFSIK